MEWLYSHYNALESHPGQIRQLFYLYYGMSGTFMNISLLQEDLFSLQIAWVGWLQELRKVHTLIRLVEVVPVETIKVILRDGFLESILHGMQVVSLDVQFGVL